MICKRCGKAFGDSEICQHCGADKVSALGEFRGYSIPKKTTNVEPSSSEYYTSSSPSVSPRIEDTPSMICWNCGEAIPRDSKYCPVCGTLLFATCPKCGHKYSAQYPICNDCGTNREQFIKKLKEQKEEEGRQKKMQEEARRQSQKEAERMRTLNAPMIVSFTAKIEGQSDHAIFQWKTINAEHCDLSWYKDRERCWYMFLPNHLDKKLNQLPSTCSSFMLDSYQLSDMCSFLRTENRIRIRLQAHSKCGESVSKILTINMRWPMFSYLKILHIEYD